MLAGSEIGEVQKPEVNRFFHLVGIGAREDDPGNVRLDYLKSIDFVWVEIRVFQGGNQVLAHG